MPPKSNKEKGKNPPQGISFTKAQQENLQHLSDLLYLFHHRNRNQHRRSVWYRHFSTFRKELSLLLSDIATLNFTPTTHLERSRKNARDAEVRGKLDERLGFWREVMVAKWHAAFSQLVADGRFAVLGLTLMAVLGEVCAVVRVTEGLERGGNERAREVIERFGREVAVEEQSVDGGGEDFGITVRRDDVENSAEGVETETKAAGETARKPQQQREEAKATKAKAAVAKPAKAESEASGEGAALPMKKSAAAAKAKEKAAGKRSASPADTKPAKKTKKRRKGDAIDDLFSGLG